MIHEKEPDTKQEERMDGSWRKDPLLPYCPLSFAPEGMRTSLLSCDGTHMMELVCPYTICASSIVVTKCTAVVLCKLYHHATVHRWCTRCFPHPAVCSAEDMYRLLAPSYPSLARVRDVPHLCDPAAFTFVGIRPVHMDDIPVVCRQSDAVLSSEQDKVLEARAHIKQCVSDVRAARVALQHTIRKVDDALSIVYQVKEAQERMKTVLGERLIGAKASMNM